MPGMMSHTEDTVRALRPYRGDTSEDAKELALPPIPPTVHSSSIRDGQPPQSSKSHATIKPLIQEETIELIRRAVENGLQETQRSLPGSEAVDDVVRPKLTIDLGHSTIDRIPEAVVDIIKAEVARLDHSVRITDCSYRPALGYSPCHSGRHSADLYQAILCE